MKPVTAAPTNPSMMQSMVFTTEVSSCETVPVPAPAVVSEEMNELTRARMLSLMSLMAAASMLVSM